MPDPDANLDRAPAATTRRVCLVGAGFVADAHAAALASIAGVEAVAVCDPGAGRARALAERWGIEVVFGSLEEALAGGGFDAAHVLAPPPAHAEIAAQLIEAGIDVLVEKPMALSAADCERLTAAAQARGVRLAVNHNATYFPAHLELRRRLAAGEAGRLLHLNVVRNLPVGALPGAAHWVMSRPANTIFESAVHPLSQINDIVGPTRALQSTASGRRQVTPERHYFDTWQVSMTCERAGAQLLFSVLGAYPVWQLLAICEDGLLVADMENGRVETQDTSRWPGYVEPLRSAARGAAAELRVGAAGLAREAGGVLGASGPSDAFSVSVRGAVEAFYRGPSLDLPAIDGAAATAVIATCEKIVAPVADEEPRRPPARADGDRCDVLVIGGTGFIGRSLVGRLLAEGQTVRVMARGEAGLPDGDAGGLQVALGDVTDPAAVARAVAGAARVVHLAHGGSFDRAGLEAAMVAPSRTIAEECLRGGCEQLVFVGSISSLDLGDRRVTITGATPSGGDPRVLGDYGWAKARSEEILLGFAATEGLPLAILRPGIVLGPGGLPLHPGLGQWRGTVHCIGWNAGRNPMPLVLVEDVAAAIGLALDSDARATYNLVGPVRPSARECVELAARTLGRPLVFHPGSPLRHEAVALAKWSAKSLLRGAEDPAPRTRMFRSLACESPFDCGDVEAELGWAPLADAANLPERAWGTSAPA